MMKKQLFLFTLALSPILATSAFAASAPRPLSEPWASAPLSRHDETTPTLYRIADDRDMDRAMDRDMDRRGRRGGRDLDDEDYYGRAERRHECCDEDHGRGEHYGRGMERRDRDDRMRDDRMRDDDRDREEKRDEPRAVDKDTK